MGLKNDLQREDGLDFCKNNGIVMRTVTLLFRRGWFKYRDLLSSLDAYNLDRDDVADAVLYFDDREYIEARDIKTREIIRVCDAEDMQDLELRLKADGVLIGKSIIDDAGIDL